MENGTYTVGELAQIIGVNIQTVRYYERISLLPVVSRSINGYREYSDLHIKFMEHIIFAKKLGFSLNEIKDYINDARTNNFNEDYILDVLREKKAHIDKEIKGLSKKSVMLEDKIESVLHDIKVANECNVKKVIKSLT